MIFSSSLILLSSIFVGAPSSEDDSESSGGSTYQFSVKDQNGNEPGSAELSDWMKLHIGELLKLKLGPDFIGDITIQVRPKNSSDPSDQSILKQSSPDRAHLRQKLLEKIENKIGDISLFSKIKKLADERGLRVWLFGGSASSLVRYMLWDLEREQGDQSLIPERFDYHFDSIYKSTQDLDLVVARRDGQIETETELKKFEEAMKEIVRDRLIDIHGMNIDSKNSEGADRMAAMNPDLILQNSDSLSQSLLELTEPLEDKKRIIDLAPEKEQGLIDSFLKNEIFYFDRATHESTERAKAGLNPKFISIIRFLTKALREDLIFYEDHVYHKRVVDIRFSRESLFVWDLPISLVRKKFEKTISPFGRYWSCL